MMQWMSDLDIERDDKMGKAIVKGALIGVPVTLIALTVVIYLITNNDIGDSLVTALLPGVLLGAFGGGFAGMAANM